jgi:magnesium transporter
MKNSSKQAGLPPGSIVFTGDKKVEEYGMHYVKYDYQNLEVKLFQNEIKTLPYHPSSDRKVEWYDFRGIHDTELLSMIGKTFKIHPLILEDISDVHQRPKFEEYESDGFMIVKALTFDKTIKKVSIEQVAIFFRQGLVLTFHEEGRDLFKSIRDRIENNKSRFRYSGADYLAYTLMDAVVDNYFIVLECIEDEIEALEDLILENHEAAQKSQIHILKKQLLTIRRLAMPLKEAISQFLIRENVSVEDSTLVFIRDLYDHIVHITDTVDNFRDMLNGLQDIFLSEVSMKMNKIMHFLTLISTVFIPLTFLTGLYGMNFDNMPELHYKYGYFVLWGLMITIFTGLLWYFKRKKWI